MLHLAATVGSMLLAAAPAADPAVELAGRIDARIAARWEAANIVPAAAVDDAEFLRRISLDLTGCIPTAGDVNRFLDDPDPAKRQRRVERLLDSAAFARHWATVLAADWVPQASEPVTEEFRLWIEGQLRQRTSYDRLVRQLLTADVRPGAATTGDRGFLVANDFKPENLAAATARQFAGLNLDCAQCHNHPFARWTQEQFWEFAAFFTDARAQGSDELVTVSISIPPGEKSVAARFPDGKQPQWGAGDDPRVRLVDWITARDSSYFARNAVNRLWAYFLGTGLIEPLDDLSGAVPASHPELLEELAEAYVSSGYDTRYLMRAIMASRAYQLTSAIPESTVAEPQMFARMPLRPLSAEQLLASFLTATGLPSPDEARRQEFLARFRSTDRRTEPESSVLSALQRMNGPLAAAATRSGSGPTLTAIAKMPAQELPERIEMLYLAALSRRPTADEAQWTVQHVATATDPGQGLSDIFWVLLNSAEFGVNH